MRGVRSSVMGRTPSRRAANHGGMMGTTKTNSGEEIPLAQRPFRADDLRDAWEDVRQSSLEDGKLGGSAKHFERHLDNNLARLERALAGGWYWPKELQVVRIPKEDGTTRILHVPAVVDRVVERTILNHIGSRIDVTFCDAAHAYRPGRGVQSAVQAVVSARESGLGWVARGDVEDCFPSISPAMVVEALAPFKLPSHVQLVIERLLGRRARAYREEDRLKGIPQGSPLSPLFMNLVLTPFDEEIAAAGIAMVRYADDFALVTTSKEAAADALTTAKEALAKVGLTMNHDKTDITSFDVGFEFLGEDFGPRYPLDGEDADRSGEPRTVFVGKQGARVRNVRGRVLVQSADDEELLDVPESRVGRLVLAGSVGLSAGARSWALMNDIPVTLLSRSGSFLGELIPAGSPTRIRRIRAQLEFSANDEQALAVARTCVIGKIRKQRVVLQRAARGHGDAAKAALASMAEAVKSADKAESIDTLMGFEGVAARAYFSAIGQLVPDGVKFEGRSRQPPADVLNAALSYGYSILLGECIAALASTGLDASFGLLHDSPSQNDRPSLALDLMEEFRPWVVDSTVFALARRKELTADHGEELIGRSGIWLTHEGKRRLIEAYEARMLTKADSALPNFHGSIRRCLYRQAQRLARHIDDPTQYAFTECSWR